MAQSTQKCPKTPLKGGDFLTFGAVRLHVSHHVAAYRGVIWCERCGAWTSGQRARLLASACERIQPHMRWGREQLRKLKPPVASTVEWDWPEPPPTFAEPVVVRLFDDSGVLRVKML